MSGKSGKSSKKGNEPPFFPAEERECVWMKAKVVNFKLCEKDYDCAACPFDKAMREAWNQGNGPMEKG